MPPVESVNERADYFPLRNWFNCFERENEKKNLLTMEKPFQNDRCRIKRSIPIKSIDLEVHRKGLFTLYCGLPLFVKYEEEEEKGNNNQ